MSAWFNKILEILFLPFNLSFLNIPQSRFIFLKFEKIKRDFSLEIGNIFEYHRSSLEVVHVPIKKDLEFYSEHGKF